MNIETQKKIIDLINSKALKDKVIETNYQFDEKDLILIIDLCCHNFAKRSELFEEFSLSAKEPLASYAIACRDAYIKNYENFKQAENNDFYRILIKWPKKGDSFNFTTEKEFNEHTEIYFASTYDEIVKYMDIFYRHSHLAGSNRRQKALYIVKKFHTLAGEENKPLAERTIKDNDNLFITFDSEKNLVNMVDAERDFPSCKVDGEKFTLSGNIAHFPNYVKDGDILKGSNAEFTKYFVAVGNHDDVIDRIHLVDIETKQALCIHPDFVDIISLGSLPSELSAEYEKIIASIKNKKA